MRVLVALAVALSLNGCASPQEVALADDRKCQADGLKPETNEYSRCRRALADARQQQNVLQAMKDQQQGTQRDAQQMMRMPR